MNHELLMAKQVLIFLLLQIVNELHVLVGDLLYLLETLPFVVFGDRLVLQHFL